MIRQGLDVAVVSGIRIDPFTMARQCAGRFIGGDSSGSVGPGNSRKRLE
jgi:hypothetical protein